MKIVQVGLGGFGGVWLEQVVHPHEQLEIVGLVDVKRAVFDMAKAKLGLADSLYGSKHSLDSRGADDLVLKRARD